MANESFIDEAVSPRLGEELDLARVSNWVKNNCDSISQVDDILQFTGGMSNLTYLLQSPQKELVLRRGPTGNKAVGAHDMSREYRALSKLKPHYSYCPEALAFCEEENVIGDKFYVMERLHGIVLRRDLPEGFKITEKQATKLSEQLVDVQAKLHKVDPDAAGLMGLGNPNGYIERQINGWITRFSRARTNDVAHCEDIMEWLQENIPEVDESEVTFLHNDYRLDNIMLDPKNSSKVLGVLDWEMATVGHPLMDLGITLAYWVQEDDPEELQMVRQSVTNLPGMLTRKQYIARYAKKTGYSVKDIDFYYVYGLFRLIGIMQQIYYRHIKGQTRNPAFAEYGEWVNNVAAYTDDIVAKL